MVNKSINEIALERLIWLATSSGSQLSPGVQPRSHLDSNVYGFLLEKGLIEKRRYKSSETLIFPGVTLTDKGRTFYQRMLQSLEEF